MYNNTTATQNQDMRNLQLNLIQTSKHPNMNPIWISTKNTSSETLPTPWSFASEFTPRWNQRLYALLRTNKTICTLEANAVDVQTSTPSYINANRFRLWMIQRTWNFTLYDCKQNKIQARTPLDCIHQNLIWHSFRLRNPNQLRWGEM